MNIAIDARGINWYKGTGIGTYTDNVLNELLEIDDYNNYSIYWSMDDYSRLKKKNTNIIMTSRRHQRFFEQNYFPNHLKRENIDIFWLPQNGMGLLGEGANKYVITIHDLIPYTMPETVGRGYLSKFLREMPHIIEKSHGILTVSEWSKNDILKFFPIDENKIHVTPLAANNNYRPLDKVMCKEYLKNNLGIDKEFVLYVGGFSKRKNVKSLVDILDRANVKKDYLLVLPGSIKDEGQKLLDYVKSKGLERNVIFPGYCSEETLAILYNSCSLFVYPSFYEGFGLPPLEAMCCGAPLLCSNLTSIPEVVGDNGVLFDPYDNDMFLKEFEDILNDCDKNIYFKNKSLERAKNFSWRKTAEKTLIALNNIHNSC
ncbi:glycosyltransferase family 4 protein [Clostridium hydrogeniformans]|uniref:glycosyltransferase family 4 protein n=1 Tax=Clostridium hydrogeniformans TaxID=349933 RepID=UPI000488F6C4|nr:glycosyltransferase family 1 protein [Clostridium hydrogeniformans]